MDEAIVSKVTLIPPAGGEESLGDLDEPRCDRSTIVWCACYHVGEFISRYPADLFDLIGIHIDVDIGPNHQHVVNFMLYPALVGTRLVVQPRYQLEVIDCDLFRRYS